MAEGKVNCAAGAHFLATAKTEWDHLTSGEREGGSPRRKELGLEPGDAIQQLLRKMNALSFSGSEVVALKYASFDLLRKIFPCGSVVEPLLCDFGPPPSI